MTLRDNETPPTGRPRFALRAAGIVAGLLALTLVTRLGYLQRETIDWDEHTFILIASAFAHGSLPYLQFWDVKPPAMFFTLGWAMQLFGDDMATVRGYGALCVFGCGIFVWLICRRRYREWIAVAAGALTVATASPATFQSVATQQPAILFLMAALWLTLCGRTSLASMAAVGFLMSMATLSRTNMILPVVVLGLYLAAAAIRPRPAVHRWAVAAYVAGGLVPLACVVGTYLAAGAWDDFWFANVTAPLSYSSEGQPVWMLVLMLAGGWINRAVAYWGTFLPFTLLLLAAFWLSWSGRARGITLRERIGWGDSDGFVTGLFGWSVLVSMTLSGALMTHHLIMLIPFAAILTCRVLAAGDRPRLRLAARGLATVAISGAVLSGAMPAFEVVRDWNGFQDRYPMRMAAARIAEFLQPGDTVFAVERHLVYWYLDIAPPSLATHPSTLTRRSLMRPLVESGRLRPDEFLHLLEQRPRFIVTAGTVPWYLDEDSPERAAFERTLQGYSPFWEAGGVHVYRRP